MLAALAEVVRRATASYENWDYSTALDVTESFFWTFCDDYLELVKERAYGSAEDGGPSPARLSARAGRRPARAGPGRPRAAGVRLAAGAGGAPPATLSARAALRLALSVQLRLLAPVLCFATEEVWSWWHEEGSSVHVQPWPSVEELAGAADGDAGLLAVVGQALSGL